MNRALLSTIMRVELKHIVSKTGKLSIPYFMIVRSGATRVGDLSHVKLGQLVPFIDRNKIPKIKIAVTLGIRGEPLEDQLYIGQKFKPAQECSSKEIRNARADQNPIRLFKVGLALGRNEALTWLYQLSKLTSTSHKNTILKAAHGDIYTNERKFRFGLVESPACPRCDQVETLEHKLVECTYTRKIWTSVRSYTGKNPSDNPINDTFAVNSSDLTELTIHAEIIQRILYLKEDQNYLLHPKTFVKLAIKELTIKEGNSRIKNTLRDLLA